MDRSDVVGSAVGGLWTETCQGQDLAEHFSWVDSGLRLARDRTLLNSGFLRQDED